MAEGNQGPASDKVRTRRSGNKILLSEAIKPVVEQLEIRRLLSVAGGGLDTAFGVGGKTTTDFNAGTLSRDQANALAIDTLIGNDIVTAGVSGGKFAVAVYSPSGALLGPSATTTTQIGTGSSEATSVAIDSSGRILVGGVANSSTTGGDFVIARYNIVGLAVQLDTSFGAGGYRITDINSAQQNDSANAIAMDGSDVLLAGSTGSGASEHAVVAAYNAGTGALDTSFGTNGVIVASGSPDAANGIVVAGSTIALAGANFQTSHSELDLINGSSLTRYALTLGANDSISSIALNPANGEYLVAGTAGGGAVVGEVKSDGKLDPTFGVAGETVTQIGGSGSFSQANGLAVQANGKIDASGYTSDSSGVNSFFVARYNANGTADSGAFGAPNGYVTTQLADSTNTDINFDSVDATSGPVLDSGSSKPLSTYFSHFGITIDESGGGAPLIVNANTEFGSDVTPVSSPNVLYAGYVTAPGPNSYDMDFATPQAAVSVTRATLNADSGQSYPQWSITALDSHGNILGSAGEGQFITSSTHPAQVFKLGPYASPIAVLRVFADSSTSGHSGAILDDLTLTSLPAPATSIAAGIAIQPDGKIIAAGSAGFGANEDFAVARYVSNNAPVAATSPAALNTILQNETNSPGTDVHTLVQRLGATDVDGDALGIAITAIDNTNGTWQYSVDSGGHWTNIPAVGDSSALLLSDAAANLVRFVPTGSFTGTSSIGLRIWDQTKGTNGFYPFSTTDNAAANYNSFSDNTYNATVSVSAKALTVYVNASWAGTAEGGSVSDSSGSHTFGIDAFATIQNGANFVAPSGTVHVDAGLYHENVTVSQPEQLLGANSGVAGSSASRSAESEVLTNGNQNAVFTISSNGVTINGFDIEGDDPAVAGGSLTSGDDSNATYGIRPSGAFSNVTADNNIVRDVAIGFRGDGAASGNVISANWFDSIGVYDFGYAVSLRTNFYADVTNNKMTRVQSGLHVSGFSGATGPASWLFQGNTVEAYGAGVWDNLQFNGATSLTIDHNTISSLTAPNTPANALVRSNFDGNSIGIFVVSIQDHVGVNITNNDVSGMGYGVTLYNTTTSNTPTIGASNTIHDNGVGVYLTNIVDFNPVSRTELGGDPNHVPAGFTGPNSATGVGQAVLSGLTLSGNTTGVLVRDNNSFITFGVGLTLQNGVVISGGATGLSIAGPRAVLNGNTTADMTFSGQSGNYVSLSNGAEAGQTLDATGSTFGSVGPADNVLTDLYGVEDKIADAIDDGTVGFVRLRAGNVYVTPNSFVAPAADATGAVQRAVNAASTGDTVHVEDGLYPGQVEIAKSLTLDGGGSGTIIQATAALPAFFTSSAANHPVVYIHNTAAPVNVNVENLTVDGNGEGGAGGGGVNTRIVGIGFHNAGGLVDHVTVEHVRETPLSGDQQGNGILAFDDDSASRGLTITNSTVFDYQKNGMTLAGDGLTVDVENNVVTGAGATSLIAQNGIQLGSGAGGIIKNNTVSGNIYTGSGGVDSTDILLFQSAASSVTGNLLSASDVGVSGNFTTGSTSITGNTITSADGAGISVFDGQFTVTGNSVKNGVGDGGSALNTGDGIDIFDDSGATTAILDGNTLQGNTGAGVSISGVSASGAVVLAQNNVVTGDGEGFVISGGSKVDLGEVAPNASFTSLGTSVGNNTLTGYSGGPSNYAIDDENSNSQANVYAQNNNFGPVSASNESALQAVIHDHGTNPAFSTVVFLPPNQSTVHNAPTDVYVNAAWAGTPFGNDADGNGPGTGFGFDEFSSIQAGVNAVAAGGRVHVAGGTYIENVTIAQPVTILGPNAGINPNGGNRSAEAIVEPPSEDHLHGNLFFVQASNVTIDGLTLNGSNAALGNTGAQLADGSWSQAGYGVSNAFNIDASDTPQTAYDISNLTVSNNIMANFAQSAVIGDDGAMSPTSNNTISNNLIQNISASTGDSFGYAIEIVNNFYATITGNHVVGSQNDIQVENFFLPDPNAGPTVDLVSNNVLDYLHRGIFLNLQYESASPWAISNNSVTADAHAGVPNKGISVESVQGTVSETLTGNNINGSSYGFELWNLPTTGTISVSGGSITGTNYGIWATNNAEYGLGAATSAVISGVTISGAATAGIYVQGDTGAGTAPVSLDVSGSSISNSPTGILVSGGNASANIHDNDSTFSGNGTAIAGQNSASVTSTNNHIEVNSFQFGIGRGISSSTGARVSSNRDSVDMDPAEFAQLVGASNLDCAIYVDGGSFSGSNDVLNDPGNAGVVSHAIGLYVGDDENPTESVSLNFTKITFKDSVVDDCVTAGVTVDTSGNAWSSNTEAGVAGGISGAAAGQVDYSPWLDSAKNLSTTGGFSGDFSVLDVGSGGAQTAVQGLTEQGRINEALALLKPQPGEVATVQVFGASNAPGATGVFKEDVTINQRVFMKAVLGVADIDGDGLSDALTVSPGGSGSTIQGFGLDGASKDAAKMSLGATNVTLTGNTLSSSNKFAVEMDGINSPNLITDNIFQSTGAGNVQVADGSNTLTGNTFTSPPAGSSPGFEQFLDGSGSFDPNGGEITTLLSNNTFDRGVTASESVSLNFTKIVWSNIQAALDFAHNPSAAVNPLAGASSIVVSALAGTYQESIEIDSFSWGTSNLTLQGAQSGHSGADREGSTPSVSEIVITKTTDASSPLLLVTGGDVTVDGFNFDSNNLLLPTVPAVQVSGGTATIENNVIDAGGTGIEIDAGASGYGIKGTFIHMKYDAASVGYGIAADGSVNGQIVGNDIEGNGAGAAGSSARGIWIKYGGPATVGDVLIGDGTLADANTIRESPTGILADGGNADIEGNNIYDNPVGVEVTPSGGGGTTAEDDWETRVNGVQHTNGTDIKFDAGHIKWTIGDGNTFAGSNFYIVNDSSNNFDLTGDSNNTYGGYKPQLPVSPTDAKTLSSNYGVEDKTYDQLDDPNAGYIKFFTKDVFLAASSEFKFKDSLQRSVEVCDDGNNIYVQAGAFRDNGNGIIIDKAVTLLGANAGSSGADRESSAPSVSEITITKSIDMSSPGFMKMDGFDIVSTDSALPAVQLTGGQADVENNVILSNGNGVEVDSSASANWTIKASYLKYGLTASSSYGIVLEPGAAGGAVLSNDLDGDGRSGTTGMQIGSLQPGATMSVGDGTDAGANTIRDSATGVSIDATGIYVKHDFFKDDAIAADILSGQNTIGGSSFTDDVTAVKVEQGASAVITGNVDPGAGVGIDVAGNATITGNTISGDATGIKVESTGNATIGQAGAGNGNSISNNTTGIEFTAGATGSVTNNSFASATDNATDLLVDNGAGAVSIGDGNSFAGSTWYINNQSSQGFNFSADTNTTFGGINAPALDPNVAGNLPAFYGIEDKIADTIDKSGLGLVRLHSGSIFVTPNSFLAPASNDAGAIQRAVNAAAVADTVYAEAGPYSENLTIGQQITLVGAGSGSAPASNTVINATSSSSPVITVAASGVDAGHPLTLSQLYINGGADGVFFDSAVSHVLLAHLSIENSSTSGVEVHNSAVLTDLNLTSDTIETHNAGGNGFRIATTGIVNGLSIDQSHLDNSGYGFYSNYTTSSTSNQNGLTNVSITNSTFNNDLNKGLYFEKLDHATLDHITVSSSGTATSGTGIDVNLKGGAYTNVQISNSTISNSGTASAPGGTNGFGLAIKGRDDGSNASDPGSLNGVTLTNVQISNSPTDLYIDNNTSGLTVSGVQLTGSGVGLSFGAQPAQFVSLADASFDSHLQAYIVNSSPNTIDATGATFGAVGPADNTLADLYGVEDKIVDAIDVSGFGLVRLRGGNIYVTPNSFFAPATTAPSIQRGIDAATAGDTVHVESGTYHDSPRINKSLTLQGDGMATTTIDLLPAGSPNTGYLSALQVSGLNVTVDGFTIAGNDASGGGLANSDIYLTAGLGTVNITHNTILSGQVGSGSTGDDGIGILTTYTITPADFVNTLNVSNNVFQPAGAAGGFRAFYINTGVDSFNFDHNSITGNYSHRALSEANNGVVQYNVVTGVGAAGSRSAGLGTYGDTDPVTFGHTLFQYNEFNNLAQGVSVISASNSTVENNLFVNNDVAVLVDDSFAPPSGDYSTDAVVLNSIDASNTVGLENNTTQSLAATNNWWGTADGPTAAGNTFNTGSQGSAITGTGATVFVPWLSSGHNNAPAGNPGFIPDNGASFAPVTNDEGGQFSSIQSAVNGTDPGHTITAVAGTFTEDVSVSKPLTIDGAQANVDPTSGARGPESIIMGTGVNAPVAIGSGVNNVTINGFTVQSPAGGSGALGAGIYMNSSTGAAIEYNVLQNNTVGVAIGNSGGSIQHNLIQNNTAPGAGAGNGIEFFAGSTPAWNIASNKFTGNTNGDVLIAAFPGNVSNVTISNNQMVNSGGIYILQGSHIVVSENLLSGISGAAVDIAGGDSDIEVAQNDISGDGAAAGVLVENHYSYLNVTPSTLISVHNNFLENDQYGVLVKSGALTGSMSVNANSIAGNSVAGVENDSTASVDASGNWWGSATGPTTAANPGGTGDKVIGSNVTFAPWLTSGVDADHNRADGFQPSAGQAIDVSGPATSVEGATYTLNLEPSSPGSANVTAWDINWGDGTPGNPDIQHVTGNPPTVTHVYPEEGGSFTISAVATTASGPATSNSVSVTVADAALTAGALTPPVVVEGQPVTNFTVFHFTDGNPNGTASDFSALVTMGDGSVRTLNSTPSADGQIVASAGGGFDVQLTHTYGEELSNKTFSVAVTDAGGATASASTGTFSVADATLTAGALTPPVASEGIPFSNVAVFHFTDADPNGAASDYSALVTLGDGNTVTLTSTASANGQIVAHAGGGFDVQLSYTYADEFTNHTFSVVVTDTPGTTASASTSSFSVTDTPPTVDLSQSATSANEGATYSLVFGASTDPGPNHILGYAINWGDGNVSDFSSSGTPAGTVTHVYDDGPASRNIRVSIIDEDGPHANSGSWTVNVQNVAPTGTISNVFPEVNEGDGGLVKLTNPFDPSAADTSAGFTYSFSITNTHGTFALQSGSSSSVTIPGSFLDTPATDTVSASIIDKDGGTSTYTTHIQVDNVAPTVNHISNFSVGAGAAWTQNGSFTDPGNDQPWLVFVNYDEANHPGLGTLVQSGPSKSFTLGTTYNTTGTYTVQVTVEDLNGSGPFTLSGSTSFQVQVNPTTFHVTNFTQQASGFDAQFNRAANLTVLNLYHGLSSTYGAPDVTVVGASSGPVSGSLVWDPTTNTASFIKTGGVLAPDTYTVTLVSGSSAWEDTSSNLLDGSGTGAGGNYVTSFTVGALNDVVSLPDFARGPGQGVNLPATSSSAGLPVSISDGTNVTAVDFEIAYNPNLLTINTANLAAGLPAGWGVTQNNSPGLLQISLSGPTALGAGARTLLNITCSVPAGAGYAASGALRITNLRINEGAIAGTADEAVEKVALIGNASGTGIYDPFDAHLISNVVVHNATGFDAFPVTDPLIVGDVTGDGTLSGQDASLVLQESVGFNVPQIPAVPASFVPPGAPPAAGTDPQVTVPSNVLANPGGSVTLPITIDDASQLQSGLLTFSVDPSKLTLTNATLGSVDSSNWSIVFNPANGKVAISDNGNAALPSGPAVIENLTFSVAAGAASGSTPVTISSGDLNGGSLPLTIVNGSVNIQTPTVSNEFVFYNNSKFDGNDPAANPATDFAAVATDKTALLPGGTGAFANYTSYSRGLNGLLIDLANLAPGTVLSASDFQFNVGNNNTPSGWATAPAPTSVVMGTDPANSNPAVDLVWADNAIQNEWLQVTVLANSNTHLASNVVFYYGNLIGEVGDETSGTAIVNTADVLAIRANVSGFTTVGVTNSYDINRDGLVTSADVLIARSNVNGFGGLTLITVPAGSGTAPAAVAAVTPTVSPVVVATGIVTPTATSTGASTSTATTVVALKPTATTPKASRVKRHLKSSTATLTPPKPPSADPVSLFGTKKILKPVLGTTKLTDGRLKK